MISLRHVPRLRRWPVLKGAKAAVVWGGLLGMMLGPAGMEAAPAGPPAYDDVPVLVCRLVG